MTKNSMQKAEKTNLEAPQQSPTADEGAAVCVSIIGISTLLSPATSALRKSIWAVTLVVFLVTLLTQVGDRLTYFLSYPVSVDVQIINNSSLRFPAVTFCPYSWKKDQELNPMALREVYEELYPYLPYPGFKEAKSEITKILDIKQLWDRCGWNMTTMIDECFLGRGTVCDKVGEFKNVYTMLGACVSFHGHPVQLAGPYNDLYLKLSYPNYTSEEDDPGFKKPFGWSVVVHDSEDNPSILIKTHGYFVGFHWNKDISVLLKKFETLNTNSRQCKSEIGYHLPNCYVDCFAKVFVKKFRCRFPFMTEDVPYCKGEDQLEKASKDMEDMLLHGTWLPSQCACPQPCSRFLYEFRGDTTDDRSDPSCRIKVFFLDMTYEMVKESFSYGFTSLAADFGGMLGLLLGASLLTAVEILEYCVHGLTILRNRVCKLPSRKSSKISQSPTETDSSMPKP